MRELEQRLERTEGYARQPKPKPGVPPIKEPAQGEDTARLGAMLEVARLAFQTDLTRLITVHFRGTVKTPSDPGKSYSHHDLSHHGQSSDKIGQLALIERLGFLAVFGGYLFTRSGESGQASTDCSDFRRSFFGFHSAARAQKSAARHPKLPKFRIA